MRTKEIIWRGIGVMTAYGVGRTLIDKIDKATEENGTPGAIRILLSEKNASIKTAWDGDKERTKEIIGNAEKAVILVSNHPHILEPFMFLAELPPRHGLSIIAKAGGERIYGEIFRRNIITVDKTPLWETKKQKQQRQERNNRQLDEAVRRLTDNGAVLIAPDGGDGTGTWQKGSARLIEGALAMPEAYLVMANVPDSKKYEHWRLIFKRKLERNLRISEAMSVHNLPIPPHVKEMPAGNKEKLLTTGKIMKAYYDDWASRSSA